MAILEATGISKHYGGLAALDGGDFSVEEGRTPALIGPHGAGKSTFLNGLTGRVRPDTGSVSFQGRSLAGMAPHDINQLGIARVFQTPEIFPEMTCLENALIAGLAARRIVCDLKPEQAVAAGERFGLIRFGSRLDVYLPDSFRVLAREGQRMIGGESVVALLAGPGAISTTIIAAQTRALAHLAAMIGCIAVVCALLWLVMRFAHALAPRMGTTGLNIATRLLGLLLTAIAIQTMAEGLLDLLPGLR